MAALILPSRFTQQPQYAAPIDLGNQFGRYVISAVLPAALGYDLAGNGLTPKPNADIAARGGAATFTTTLSQLFYGTDVGASVFRRTTFTKVLQIRLNTLAAGQIYSTDARFNIGVGSLETITAGQLGVSIYDGAFKQISFVPTVGVLYTLVVVATSTALSLYSNGILIGTIAIGPIVFAPGRNTDYGLNTFTNSASANFDLYHSSLLSVDLSANDVAKLSANPYQIFRAPARKLWASIAAATGVSASLAWLEQNDTTSLSGSVKVTASLGWTEASDTTAITASTTVQASLAWTEASDSTSIAGNVGSAVSASLAWTEASDATAIAGTATVTASLGWTEASDTTAITGTVGNVVAANIAWTEQPDATAITGSATVTVTVSWTEASDVTAITATLPVTSTIGWTEQADAITITGMVAVLYTASVPQEYFLTRIGGGSPGFRGALNGQDIALRGPLLDNNAYTG